MLVRISPVRGNKLACLGTGSADASHNMSAIYREFEKYLFFLLQHIHFVLPTVVVLQIHQFELPAISLYYEGLALYYNIIIL